MTNILLRLGLSRKTSRGEAAIFTRIVFFPRLVEFIISAPVVAMAWEAENSVEAVGSTMGETSPTASPPGTIRGDLALDIGRNLVHGSDSPESAQRELSLFFSAAELLDYSRSIDPWIKE